MTKQIIKDKRTLKFDKINEKVMKILLSLVTIINHIE